MDADILKRGFMSEIALLRDMNHPNIPRVLDVIEDGKYIIVVMDFVEGVPLSQQLEKFGPQSEGKVMDWAKQLANVLDYLHTKVPPVIYRDVKPHNIMLKPDGRIMLIDFGTSREYGEWKLSDTTCLGTMGYAAPEQFGGMGQTDARTDIYGMGVTLYESLTGIKPTEYPYDLPLIRMVKPEISVAMEYIIEKCTYRDPEMRYQSMTELIYDLEHMDKTEKAAKRKKMHNPIGAVADLLKRKPKVEKVPKTADALPSVDTDILVLPVSEGIQEPQISKEEKKPVTAMLKTERKPGETALKTEKAKVHIVVSTAKKVTSKVRIDFEMCTDSEKESEILSRIKADNIIISKWFYVDKSEKLRIQLQSEEVFLNKHRLELSFEESVKSIKGLVAAEDKQEVALNIRISDGDHNQEKVPLRYIVRK